MSKASKSPRVSERETEVARADTTGMSVTVLHGKAREYALNEFFAEAVPAVRGEKVVKQTGLPTNLELVPANRGAA